MHRKTILFLGIGLLIATLAIGYVLRPVTISVDGRSLRMSAAGFTTGQALARAGVMLDPLDVVTPRLAEMLPLNGQVRVTRAVQALVWDEGKVHAIHGFETDPVALLSANHISLGSSDRLLWNGRPAAGETLPAGQPLVLQIVRARTIVLDTDGQRKAITTTALTNAQALWEAGARLAPGDRLSVPAGSTPEANQVIAYLPAQQLTIQVAGKAVRARSAADTVGEALAEAGVSLQGLDYSQPAENAQPPANGKIRVVRVREELSLAETLVPYERKYGPDANTDLDTVRVTQPGQYGVKVTRERARYEDGHEVSRTADSDWVASQPQAETVGYGTKVTPKKMDTPDGPIEYYRAVRVYATSFSPCRLGTPDNRCSYTTASGMRLTKGIVGVSLRWFRVMQGQKVYVPGYGFGVIGDYGAVSGMWIDLGFDEENFEEGAFVGWTTLYFLTPVPANILWTLP